MKTNEVANKLVEMCRAGKFVEAHDELYSQDCVSYEPEGWGQRETKGLEAIMQKFTAWQASIEDFHSSEISEPLVANETFAVMMRMDVTMKGQGRMDMKELCQK
jgi:hypothetical protein